MKHSWSAHTIKLTHSEEWIPLTIATTDKTFSNRTRSTRGHSLLSFFWMNRGTGSLMGKTQKNRFPAGWISMTTQPLTPTPHIHFYAIVQKQKRKRKCELQVAGLLEVNFWTTADSSWNGACVVWVILLLMVIWQMNCVLCLINRCRGWKIYLTCTSEQAMCKITIVFVSIHINIFCKYILNYLFVYILICMK